jgi:hypothetical protein
MRFTKVRLQGSQNVDLELASALPSDPYILRSIDGLDSPESGARGKPLDRQVTLHIGLNPDYSQGQTVDGLRDVLYSMIVPGNGRETKLALINNETVVAETSGFVRRVSAPQFTKEPIAQVVIDCDQPYLVAPFLTSVKPTIDLSTEYAAFQVNNPGTAPSGFWMAVRFIEEVTGTLQITENVGLGRIVSINKHFLPGATLIYDSRKGSKSLYRIPVGEVEPESILDGLSSSSPWLDLHHGINALRINHDVEWYSLGFMYTPTYWGI